MPEQERPPDRKKPAPTKAELLAKKKEFLVRAKQAGAFSLKPDDITVANLAIRLAGSPLLGTGAGGERVVRLIQWADYDPTDPYVAFDMDPRDGVVWADMDPTDPWPRRLDRDPSD